MKTTMLLIACGLMACINSMKAWNAAADNAAAEAKSAVENPSKQNMQEDNPDEITFENGVFTIRGVRYEFVLVKGGTFTMGASPEVKDAEDCEKPAREVTIDHNYYIGKTEVTVALWKAVTGQYPEGQEGKEFLNQPVDNVSADDLYSFFEDLYALIGPIFGTPSEEEWEFAARGGNESKHYIYSGSNTLEEVAWNEEGNIVSHAHDVATKKPNELGIYDMSGNVWEWCSSGDVLRGGNCTCYDGYCRVSYRRDAPEATIFQDRYPALIGFRLCANESWEEDLEEMEEGI